MTLKKVKSRILYSYIVSFAAGVMLATAFLELLPEALNAGSNTSITLFSVLIGIVAFFFLERFVLWYHHHDEHIQHAQQADPSNILVLVGDSLHNFIDGVSLAAAYTVSSELGVAVTLAIVAHEIPQEMADFGVLVHGGYSKSRALFFNFLSASTSLLGGLFGYFFLSTFDGIEPLLLGFGAGMFTYIACSDLIPGMHKEFKDTKAWTQSIPFVVGIILIYFLSIYLPA